MTPQTAITDVHAHYLPRDGIDWLVDASVPARLETRGEELDCIEVGPISVGATMGQIGDVDAIRKDMEVAGLEHPPEHAIGAEEALLTDDLVERSRPHALRERRTGARAIVRRRAGSGPRAHVRGIGRPALGIAEEGERIVLHG
jgi:hypothetical protein